MAKPCNLHDGKNMLHLGPLPQLGFLGKFFKIGEASEFFCKLVSSADVTKRRSQIPSQKFLEFNVMKQREYDNIQKIQTDPAEGVQKIEAFVGDPSDDKYYISVFPSFQISFKQLANLEPDSVKDLQSMSCCMRQFSKVIVFLHSQRIFHQALWLECIAVEKSIKADSVKHFKIVLGDFSHAKKIESTDAEIDTSVHNYYGEFAACPPEILQNLQSAEATFKMNQAELWQVGIVLYYMACNMYPFNHTGSIEKFIDDQKSLENVYNMEQPFKGTKWQNIIQRLLVVDPNARTTLEDLDVATESCPECSQQ